MTKEVATTERTTDIVQKVEMKTITDYLDATGLTNSLQENEKEMFINIAKEFGLNPFKREIYCTAYGEGKYRKCSIVTGYEVYIKRAERTGKLDGWCVEPCGSFNDGTLGATVTIYRKDWAHEFKHTVYYCECVQLNKEGRPNAVWAKQPIFMTKKVAIAQGFRMCFSDEFGGMPYTNDELGVENIPSERNVTEEQPIVHQEQPKTEDVIAPQNIQTEQVDKKRQLEDLLYNYEQYIDDNAFAMCQKAISVGVENDICDKLNRLQNYLRAQGVNV